MLVPHLSTYLADPFCRCQLHMSIALYVCSCLIHDTNNQQCRHDLHAGCKQGYAGIPGTIEEQRIRQKGMANQEPPLR